MVEASLVNIVETVGILIGVTIAIMELRKGREERRNQVSDQFLQYRYTEEFLEHWISFLNNMDFSTYEEWSEKYGPYVNPEASVHWYTLMSFFEAVGQRVIDGTMEVDAVISSLSDMMVLAVWEKSLPIFDEWRKRFNSPSMMNGFEFLYNEIKRLNSQTIFIPNPQRQRLMKR